MTTVTTTNTMTNPAEVNAPSPIVTDDNITVASPVVDPTPPAADPAAGAVTETPPGAVDPAAQTNKTTPDWAQKRINELTAKRYEAERVAQEAQNRQLAAETRATELLKQIEARSGAADPAATPPTKPTPLLTEAEIERRAVEKAQVIAQANRFNEACNTIVEVGKKEYAAAWDEAVKNLAMVGAIGEKVSPEFLETVIELKNPAKILHHLGTHMDEGARIAALSGKKMVMELARIESVLNAPPPPAPAPPAPISGAPAPVIPVGGAAKPGSLSLDDPNVSSAEWYKMRDQQVLEKRNRYKRA